MTRIADIALIMKTTPYRESSALVSFFALHQGRMTAVQKGYRRKKNPQPLEPFNLVELALVGRTNLMTLTHCEVVERIFLEGDALACGFYIYELLNRGLGEQQVEQTVFRAALAALRDLSGGQLSTTLRRFERVFIDQLGYGLNYQYEQDGSTPIVSGQNYVYQREVGFVLSEGRAGVSGRAILNMGEHRYNEPETAIAARQVYAQVIESMIGDRPMVSRALLRPMARPASATPPSTSQLEQAP